MRCGNVREIFIFIQRASRGSGKAKAGRTQLHPCQESCRSQNASNSAAKHFSREKKPKAWVMLAIRQLLPNLGEARCKALTCGSPPRGEMTSMNDSNSTTSCLEKKAHQERAMAAQVPQWTQPNGMGPGRRLSCPRKLGISTQHWSATTLSNAGTRPVPVTSSRRQHAARTKLTRLLQLHAIYVFEAYFSSLPVTEGKI